MKMKLEEGVSNGGSTEEGISNSGSSEENISKDEPIDEWLSNGESFEEMSEEFPPPLPPPPPPPPHPESRCGWPPVAPITTAITLLFLLGLLYGTAYALLGGTVLPGGSVFALLVLGVVCFLGGRLMKFIRVPTLIGMMVVGFILRNVPHVNIAKDIPDHWGSNIRNCALVLILLRAGLEVESDILRRKSSACCKIIFIPFIIECSTGTVVAKYLFDMTWQWAFLLGFMLSAVSPAVVLPVMLKLQAKGIGTKKGIPTMVIAVAGIDDVLAVTGFEIVQGLLFPKESESWLIAQGPVQIIVGIVYGLIMGVITWYLPSPEEKSCSVLRFLFLTLGGLFVLFFSHRYEWGAAGALGCIVFPFVAALRWKTPDWDNEHNPISTGLTFVWRIIEPFLFGLVGSEIKLEYLAGSTVGLSLAIFFVALALRMVACLLAAYWADFTLKEQIFVAFAGLPKATVQAAIGPSALVYVTAHKMGPEMEKLGIQVLTVAVLSILIAAPVGATAITFLAPRLLDDEDEENKDATAKKKSSVMMDSTNTMLTLYNSSEKLPSIS